MAKEPQEGAATAAAGKPTKRKKEFKKKRERRVVPHGLACIQATFNNTIVTITAPDGRVLAAFLVGFGGLYEGLTMLPLLTHAIALNALPSTVARVVEALVLATGIGALGGSVLGPLREAA